MKQFQSAMPSYVVFPVAWLLIGEVGKSRNVPGLDESIQVEKQFQRGWHASHAS